MDDFPLIIALPLVTIVLAIAFAVWSKKRTDNTSADVTTPLARSEPDPNLRPDPKVTDPHGVTR